jgi:uncharacterized protein (UPF0335 family)
MLAENTLEGRAKPFIERVENVMKDLESLKGQYMLECKELRSDIKEIYVEAKDADLSVKALKKTVKYRELERKQSELGDGLEDRDAVDYEALILALGELGQAAADRAGHKPNGDDADVRPDFLKAQEKERADADALAKVGKGKLADAADSIASKH